MSDDPFDVSDVPDPPGGGGGSVGSGSAGHRRWPWFLAGIALGVAATLLVPRYVTPHLPAALRSGELQVRGPVLAEQREEDRLLLTVRTDQGAVLATFRREVAEIALLVDEGDTLTLGLREVRPFVEEPTLVQVDKGLPPEGSGAEEEAGLRPAVPDTMSQAAPPPAATDSPPGPDGTP